MPSELFIAVIAYRPPKYISTCIIATRNTYANARILLYIQRYLVHMVQSNICSLLVLRRVLISIYFYCSTIDIFEWICVFSVSMNNWTVLSENVVLSISAREKRRGGGWSWAKWMNWAKYFLESSYEYDQRNSADEFAELIIIWAKLWFIG